MNIKGFVYCLSHDCPLDIDRDVSTAYCRSSSGNSVVLLSTTICTNMVVSDFVLQSIVGIITAGKFKLFLKESAVVAIAFSLQRSRY